MLVTEEAPDEVTGDSEGVELDLKARVEELEKELQYSKAETANAVQRAARDRSEALKYGGSSLARRLIHAVDLLGKAVEASDEGDGAESVIEGVRLTLEGARAAMESEGVVKIEVGSAFDPTTMEAIATVPVSDGGKPGSVIEIVEVGYMYHDRILRAARVIVAEDE